jgi:protein SCO1
MTRRKRLGIYVAFFAVLLAVFYYAVFRNYDFSASSLGVINPAVPAFNFTNQDGKTISQKDTDDKVYVVEYFFTTCKGICPKMNANMRRVYDAYKDRKDFLILSHTCQPEVDSVPQMKAYEQKMINAKLLKADDGSYSISKNEATTNAVNTNWIFLTGKKDSLYKMARVGYIIDNQKPDSTQNIANQFIHTQFFAVVDRYRRVRGVYDGLKEDEIQKLLLDIKSLLKEKVDHTRFMNGFSNAPY